jgi:site-specific DNA recombinase
MRAQALIDSHGEVVSEFFDIGQSRSIPWQRRPRASALLAELKSPQRSFDAVVIGEPQRAFYGNQFGLTFPIFVHYGVTLWVPEVGGPIDPESEAHDLVMSVFGGMSKGERNRIKIRTRTAMSSQAEVEGRYLGGRPPHGYRLVDAGPHPHPGKAAEGRRSQRLEPDPITAHVVVRIFGEYLRGRGLYAIAEGLTRDGIPCPSAHDRRRNAHRPGVAWAKSAVRSILKNPRYTGYQVWNRQRKEERLINVEDVALGHETRQRWNTESEWVWSKRPVHEPLISLETYQQAQDLMGAHGRTRVSKERITTRHAYVFRGRLTCGLCSRKMQGQKSRQDLYYRCRFPDEYALANKIWHPRNLYLSERDLVRPVDAWIGRVCAPHRLGDTVHALWAAQEDPSEDAEVVRAREKIEKCDRNLERYREALEAGVDASTVASWMAEARAEKAEAVARLSARESSPRLSEEEIRELVSSVDDLLAALQGAEPQLKAELYAALGLQLTYDPGKATVRVEANLDPHTLGKWYVSGGGLEPPRPVKGTSTSS